MDRRDFIKTLGIAGGAMLLAGTAGAAAAKTTAPRKNSGIDPLLSGICNGVPLGAVTVLPTHGVSSVAASGFDA